MKKTSIALLIGLFAVGCGESAPKKTTAGPPMTDPSKMAQHMAPPGGVHAAGEAKKEEGTKTEDEKAPAADSTEAPK